MKYLSAALISFVIGYSIATYQVKTFIQETTLEVESLQEMYTNLLVECQGGSQ